MTKGAVFLLIGGAVAGLTKRQAVPPAPTFERIAGLSKTMPLTSFRNNFV